MVRRLKPSACACCRSAVVLTSMKSLWFVLQPAPLEQPSGQFRPRSIRYNGTNAGYEGHGVYSVVSTYTLAFGVGNAGSPGSGGGELAYPGVGAPDGR